MKISYISTMNICFILTCFIALSPVYAEEPIQTIQGSRDINEYLSKINQIIPNSIGTKLQYQQSMDTLFKELSKIADSEVVRYIYDIDHSSLDDYKKDLAMGILFSRLSKHDVLLEALSKVQNLPGLAGRLPFSVHLHECGISEREIEILMDKVEENSKKRERFEWILLEYREGYVPMSSPVTERIPFTKVSRRTRSEHVE